MDFLDNGSFFSDGVSLKTADFPLQVPPLIPDLTHPTATDTDHAFDPAPLHQPLEAQFSPSPEQVCAALASSFQEANSCASDQIIALSLKAASRPPTLSSAICSLQLRLSVLECKLPEVFPLRNFYSEESQKVELMRQHMLHTTNFHGEQMVQAHYNEIHFSLIDRVSHQLDLIEQHRCLHANPPSSSPAPPHQRPQRPFVQQVSVQPLVHSPAQPVHHQEAPSPLLTSSEELYSPQPLSRLSDDSGLCNTASGSAESSPEPSAPKLPSPSKLLLYKKKNVIKPLNAQATQLFEQWYAQNVDHPYPTLAEVKRMASSGGVSINQTRKWFSNKRRRDNNTRSVSQLRDVRKMQKFVSRPHFH